MVNLAIIGCGAIVESFYLQPINKSDNINKIYLIDKNMERAREIHDQLKVDSVVLDDYHTIIKKVDGVIIATPPATHFSITKDFIENNVIVLVEKPAVETSNEIYELIDLSQKNNTEILVNNTRRYFPSNQAIKKALVNSEIGEVKKITYLEGGEYNWPTVSGFYFSKESNAKGVMMDRGAHVIDLICWWLDNEIGLIKYEDDSFGGPEAFCHTKLKSSKCKIDIKLSWINKLSNEYKIIGTDGEIFGSIYNWKSYDLNKNGKKKTVKVQHKEKLFNDFGYTVFNSFIKHLKGEQKSFSVCANDVLQSIELIDEMYNNRTKINAPWQNRWIDNTR